MAKIAARPERGTKAPEPRVILTAEETEALTAIGWRAPKVGTCLTWKPEPRLRQNSCKADVAYLMMEIGLQSGPMTVAQIAKVWTQTGNNPRPLAGVLQQTANRMGRIIRQEGGMIVTV